MESLAQAPEEHTRRVDMLHSRVNFGQVPSLPVRLFEKKKRNRFAEVVQALQLAHECGHIPAWPVS